MKKTLTSIMALIMYAGLKAETVKTKQVDDGGTGSYKAMAVKDSEMPEFTIYRPEFLMGPTGQGDRCRYCCGVAKSKAMTDGHSLRRTSIPNK